METLFSASAALDDDPTSDEEMADWDSDPNNKELDDIAEILLLAGLESMGEVYTMTGDGSRGPYGQMPKSEDWFKTALQSPNHDFCHTFNTHWCQSGWAMTHLIGSFAYLLMTQSLNPELSAFLLRYGNRGSPAFSVVRDLNISEGVIFDYCGRVSKAVRKLHSKFLVWPNEACKAEISQFIENQSGFHLCIGSGDGSLLLLTEEPLVDGDQYQDWKKNWATNIQATVDHQCHFTSHELRWPGSMPDMKVWKQSHLWMHHQDYFKNGEYILVDKGDPSSLYVMQPFDEKELADASPADRPHIRAFNKRLLSVHITSEHAFGLLKGLFPLLKGMGRHKDIQDAFKAIEAMMIIHNICIDRRDRPDHIWDFDPTDGLSDDKDEEPDICGEVIEGKAHVSDHETNVWLMETGRQKHDIIFNELFPR
ncbi:hypothetical protein PILCRDRAFT_89993 [Piloderma croceum F 1598]|uniref:DDE Tnp4 domain-containing protein n=1 Tax=Piloderma croceum (strain F 1598) TaxID=765440 RepID=A0A0C3FIK4_PILCF|nr:hypothetical protein PILCRDRAFT_89993 [Piloderma croceum F 1598]